MATGTAAAVVLTPPGFHLFLNPLNDRPLHITDIILPQLARTAPSERRTNVSFPQRSNLEMGFQEHSELLLWVSLPLGVLRRQGSPPVM